MKKLMIAAAIVCAAAVSQAATANWSTGTMSYDKGSVATSGGTTVADGNYAYLFLIDATQYGKLTSGLSSQADVQAFTKAIYEAAVLDNSSFDTSTLTIDGTTINSYDAAPMTDGFTGLFDDNDYSGAAYAVVIATVVDGDNKVEAYTASAVQATITALSSDGDSDVALRWGASGSGIATEWVAQSVPEPTSGLLLLLGVAGLALRRRRA